MLTADNVTPAAAMDAARRKPSRNKCSNCNSNSYTPKPAVPKLAARKPTAAQQLTTVFAKLKHLLLAEWPSIRAMNLGVKSGTGVIDQLVFYQLSQLCMQLHMLVVSDADAAEALVRLVHRLDEQYSQQLQVLLDVCGHEELSDFLCMSVKQLGPHNHRGKQAGKPGTSVKVDKGAEAGEAAEAAWQGRNRSTGGLFDLQGLGLPANSCRHRHMGLNTSQDTTSHILTKTAEGLQRQHEFQAALDSSTAVEAAGAPAIHRQKQQEQAVPLLQLLPCNMSLASRGDAVKQCQLEAYQDVLQQPSTSGSGMLLTTTQRPNSSTSSDHVYQSCSYPPSPWFAHELQKAGLAGAGDWGGAEHTGSGRFEGSYEPGALWLPLFSAPGKSLEQIWKEGRKANTDAIFDRARLQVQQSALNCLLLEPSVMLQPHLQPAARNGSSSCKASGRWTSAVSRPASATNCSRRATRLSGIGDISFAGAKPAGAGCSAAAGSSVCPATGAGTAGTRGFHALVSGNGTDDARRLAATAAAEGFILPVQCMAQVDYAADSSSKSVGWTSSGGRARHAASAVDVAARGLAPYLQCSVPSTNVKPDISCSNKLLVSQGESLASPCGTSSAAGGMSKHGSGVTSSPVSICGAGPALVVQPRPGALQAMDSVLGAGGPIGVQKRAISAESDRSRPVSAASTSRLRASTRGELL